MEKKSAKKQTIYANKWNFLMMREDDALMHLVNKEVNWALYSTVFLISYSDFPLSFSKKKESKRAGVEKMEKQFSDTSDTIKFLL